MKKTLRTMLNTKADTLLSKTMSLEHEFYKAGIDDQGRFERIKTIIGKIQEQINEENESKR